MQRCAELGMPALAMTDHGNLFGAINFYKAAQKAGIKPLIGCEIYLVYDHSQSDRPKRDRQRSDDIDDIPEDELGPENYPKFQIHHKTIIAQNFTGYQNLVKLVSDAHVNGVYYRPRTDMERLAAHSEGLIALSGCLNGVAAQHLLYNDYEGARKATARMVDIFGRERYFIEIHNHGMRVEQRIIPGLLKLAKEFELKVVCANDVHYVYREDYKPHDALLCIQTGKLIQDEKRMRYPNQEFYLKSHAEMAQAFPDNPEALTNTLAVAEMVDLRIQFGEDHYPVFERAQEVVYQQDGDGFDRILDIYIEEKNKIQSREGKPLIELTAEQRERFRRNGEYLFDLCKAGLFERYGVDYDALRYGRPRFSAVPHPDSAYAERVCRQLEYELAIITGTGFVDYFLITWDFIHWARLQDIPVGPGRGSGAGCVVAFVLKITDIDPLRFGLLFERMLNLERVSPPDFDVDFCMRRRDEVVDYVRRKYGADKVANIITYGKFGAKMVVKDLARVMSVEYAEAAKLAKMVPEDLNISLDDAVAKSHELQAEIARNPVVAEIIRQGKVIEGMVRNTSKHACGIIISDQPLTQLVPVTLQEGALTTQYAKGPVEELGLLKCDFLGLKTLTVISDAQAFVRETTGNRGFDIERVSLEDSRTYALLNTGKTTGVFQLESGGMQALCRQIGLSSFEEIIALIALYRPGPMQFIDQYVKGKKDPSTVVVPHPLLKDLVLETYGVLVYQEQVMEAARIIAGYTLGGADMLRRAMGKKVKEIMDQQKEIFIAGAKEKNHIDRRTAEEIFAILEKFAQYGFNKSHSAAYAMLSYRTAFLKANYPVEFMAAVLGCELGNAEKVSHFIEECASMEVSVLGPDVNESGASFTPVVQQGKSSIRFGLAAIKGVGDGAAEAIIAERKRSGPYQDFEDFVSRLDSKVVNRRVLENLIKTGAFDEFGDDRADLLLNMDTVLREVQDLQKDAAAGQINMFDLFEMAAPKDNKKARRKAPHPMLLTDKLQLEKDLLGFYVSGHPMNAYRGLTESIDSFQGEDYKRLPNREPFRLCGVLTKIDKKLARKDNRPWAAVTLSSRTHTYNVNVFADTFERCKHLLEENRIVVVEGQVGIRNDDEYQLMVNKLIPIDEFLLQNIKELTFVLEPDSDCPAFLQALRDELEHRMGVTKVRLGFVVADDQLLVADIASSLTWQVNKEQFGRLRVYPGVKDVLIDLPVVELPKPRWERN